MKSLVIYIHGKGGDAKEARHYQSLFSKSDIVGFEYQSENPWEAEIEFADYFDLQSKGYDEVILIANSIGAYFSMCSLAEKNISKSFFISPIVNMEKLINDRMRWANVTETELKQKGEIVTPFGETLSWDYLCYVRRTPIKWEIPTYVLYGEKDGLTSISTITEFSERIGASLTVMKGGEHWFHTEKQIRFLDDWIKSRL